MELDLNILNIIVGTLIPLAVGLVTKADASTRLKTWVNAGLSALSAAVMVVIGECAGGAACELAWGPFITTFFMTYVPNIATYYGFWKPNGAAQAIQARTANVGLGGTRAA